MLATITNSEIPANGTAAQVRAALQQAWMDAGMSFVQEISSSSTPTSVFSVSKTDGSGVECYAALRYASTTSTTAEAQLWQTFSGGTLSTQLANTGVLAVTATGSATAISAINHPQLRGCVVAYGASFQLLAVQLFDPVSKPAWLTGPHVAMWLGMGATPNLRGNGSQSVSRILRGVSDVRADGLREAQPVLEFQMAGRAFFGRTSEDIVSVAGAGAATLDTFVAGDREYLTFYSGNTETCAVRVK